MARSPAWVFLSRPVAGVGVERPGKFVSRQHIDFLGLKRNFRDHFVDIHSKYPEISLRSTVM